MQRAGHPGVRHRAHKYGNVLCKTVNQKTGGRREGDGEAAETDEDIGLGKDVQTKSFQRKANIIISPRVIMTNYTTFVFVFYMFWFIALFLC